MSTDDNTDLDAEVAAFWEDVKHHAHLSAAPGYFGASPLESLQPPAWSFGGTPEEAEEALELVLDGLKTATASALWDYEEGIGMPTVGTLGIVLDGEDHPRALIVTTAVDVVPFSEVSADYVKLEGEADLSLDAWRARYEQLLADDSEHTVGPETEIVLEQFELIWPKAE